MWNEEKLDLYTKRSRRIMQGITAQMKKRKKIQILLGICLILWAAAGAQWFVKRIVLEPKEITEVFAETNSILTESMIEIVAEYGNEYLTQEDKKELLRYIGAGIGLEVDGEINMQQEGSRQVYFYEKQGKQAETVLKCVTLGESDTGEKERKHYIMIRLSIYEDTNDYILKYQKKIRKILEELNAEELSCTVQFSGNFEGKLSVMELDEITNKLLNKLEAKVVCENRAEELYTVYAYKRGQERSILVDGNLINLQVAATYLEEENKTKIYLATPVIRGEW